jgi:regulation of enolase protein 1 (concanavalin A-like superfamily)
MGEAVHIGLAVTSHDADRIAQARFASVTVSGNVSPAGPFTTSEDINVETLLSSMSKSGVKSTPDSNEARPVAYPGAEPSPSVDGAPTARQLATLVLQHGGSLGSIRYEQAIDTYTVVGSGKDIWETSDEFHFAYKKLAGDGAIVARIHSVTNTNPWAKAGVMMRDALTCDSEHASVFITPENRVCLQYRSASRQNALSIHTDPNAVSLPHWVRLVREGNAFRAQHSDDGRKWKDLQGSDSLTPGAKTWRAVVEIPMNESIYIGLAVTSHTAFLTAEAKMSHVSVTGNVSPPGEFLWSEDIGFQMILLPKK